MLRRVSRPRPGAVLGRVLAVLALTPVLALGAADRALAMEEEPAVVPTTVLPGPDEPDPPSSPEPDPEPEPVPTTAAPTTAAPQPTREPARTPEPTSTRTAPPSPIATLLQEVTSSPSPTSTMTRPPIPVGGLVDDDEEPVEESDAAEHDGPPADPLTRLVQLVIGGAVLLGVGGGVGLYLTREGR